MLRACGFHFFSNGLSAYCPDWSLHSVFDRTVDRACPVARSSAIHIDLPINQPYAVDPQPSLVEGFRATYDALELASEYSTDAARVSRALADSCAAQGTRH